MLSTVLPASKPLLPPTVFYVSRQIQKRPIKQDFCLPFTKRQKVVSLHMFLCPWRTYTRFCLIHILKVPFKFSLLREWLCCYSFWPLANSSFPPPPSRESEAFDLFYLLLAHGLRIASVAKLVLLRVH